MTIREMLDSNREMSLEDGLYFYNKESISSSFEKLYLEIREKEGRIYPDEVVMNLPDVSDEHPLRKEWTIRKKSSDWLTNYLSVYNLRPTKVLEVGCGNGWLSNKLYRTFPFDICGVDINESELKQASRLSKSKRLLFVHGNILEDLFPSETFEIIVLASSIQYFPDLNLLIKRLLELLKPFGEIHILDSPICDSIHESKKKSRSSYRYFSSLGFSEMSAHYFYHTWEELAGTKFTIMFDPKSWKAFLKRRLGFIQTPFPWIKILRD